MTVERKIAVGLEDIEAICFECLKQGCGYKVSISPDAFERIPQSCEQCGSRWTPLDNTGVSSSRPWVFSSFANSLKMIRNLIASQAGFNFRVLLEFKEPKQ
jgi:hypothetical protein